VDGLPLAIELAAARIKLFSPQALLSRLEKSLTALGSGARDLPSRQQTLRGAIQWSYEMIDAPGRRLLARFSVFARGGSLEQVESVCGPPDDIGGDVIDMLDQLADQSLVRRLPDFSEPRFLMLQTIREFMAEQLEALEAAGGLAYWQADMESAQRFYDECLELTRTTGDKQALANALYNAAFPNVVNMRESERPRQLLLEALPLFRELGDQSS